MTNTKSTRRALFASAMALLLCFTMLLGTTYAWFTDSVVSENNIIVAGNLDVKLYWSTDASNWDEVDESTNVFTDTKWEPGHTEVVYLKVENAGNLALKYQLGLNVVSEIAGINVDEKPFKLSNYIQFDVIETETAFADRDAARAAVKDVKLVANSYSNAAKLEKNGEFDVVALVVYMPETVGNEANYKTGTAEPEINLGLSVFATQLSYESDSFDNQYDSNAAFSVWDGTVPAEKPASLVVDTANKLISINDAAAFAYLNTLINDANFYDNYGSKWQYSIELNADIDLANNAWTPIELNNFVSFDGNGHTIKNLYVDTTAENAGLFATLGSNDKGGIFVKNFTISNAFVRSAKRAGAVAGTAPQGIISNVTVEGATVIGTKYVGGIFGGGNGSVINSIVKDSFVIIPEGGEKEAGGLIGYLANDGKASSVNKVISGNIVENVTVSAPTVASALVSQPNSANSGTAVIVVEFNTVKNATVTTADDTADIFVSNNVGGKSIVANNTEIGCTVNKAGALPAIVENTSELKAAANTKNSTVVLTPGTYTTVALAEGVTLIGSEGTVIEQASGSEAALGSTKNTTIKNVEFVGTNAQRWGYAGGEVVFENCTFKGEGTSALSWAIHYDGLNGANILYKDCEIYGWVAIGGGAGSLVFDGCNFYGNGAFGLCRAYSDFTVKNCTFDYSNTDGSRSEGIQALSGATVTIENCTNVNGDIEDVINMDYVGTQYEGKVILDGVVYTPAP